MANIYMLQAAFTTGEISPAVGNRVDLDKYKSALLNAENTVIRPYGGCYRRQGSKYIGALKYNDKDAVLVNFYDTENSAYLLEVGVQYIRIWKDGVYTGTELATPYQYPKKLQFTQSADVMFICSGIYPVKQLRHLQNGWDIIDFAIDDQYYDLLLEKNSSENKIRTSGTSGNITITSNQAIFQSGMEGGHIKISHDMPSQTISWECKGDADGSTTSASIFVGEKWKFVTHGTHHYKVVIQKSTDNVTWHDFRTYTSNDDTNYTESGAETEPCYMRFVAQAWNDDEASNSHVTVDLTRLSYVHTGCVKITGITSATVASGTVVAGATIGKHGIGSTESTADYAFSSWSNYFGYPTQSCFFQDRLCFAATARQPYSIWMSRTGDYGNFSVEKVDGTLTDDSAVKLDLIVRNAYQIRHMIPSNDLVILTSGNEWVISGDSAITPSKVFPKAQTMRGSSTCLPQHIGNRIIHVQRSGSTVRDLGYQYESDNYNGDELDILATHLVKDHRLISSAYCQEPDSTLFFVRDDGVLLAFTIIREQQVFAWSHFITDGKYKWICTIPADENDELYAIVERTINGTQKRCIERFKAMHDDTDEYVDSYATGSGNSISLPHLAGKTIAVVGDGIQQRNEIVPGNGVVQLQETYKKIIAGLPYMTKIEQPGAEISLQEGTLQARVNKINAVTLRVENTYGGRIGLNFKRMDELKYDDEYKLFTGDIVQSVPLYDVGANTRNHLCIMSDEPYPFRLNAIIKEVSVDGGMVKSYTG